MTCERRAARIRNGGSVSNPFESDEADYLVLVNGEGQYSLWPASIEIPAGWIATGPKGKRQVCLDWIETTWTDMRPKSLIAAMEGAAARQEG
jgi:uncharacterized protein YbdZ (MbtH family)